MPGRRRTAAAEGGADEQASRSMPPNVPPNVHIFSLTFVYFAASLLMFLASLLLGLRLLPEVIASGPRGPAGWTLTHMLVLGFMTMLAMGASFQLIQVLLKTKLFSRALGFLQFAVYALGLIVLIPSFYRECPDGIVAGGSLVAAAVLLYAFNLAATMVRKRTWNAYAWGVSLSLIALLVTVGSGIGMGIIGGSGQGVHLYERLFGSHLWFGLGGWMSGLIVTFSFKLLPMFYVSSKKADTEAWWIIGLFQAGIWLRTASIWLESDLAKLCAMLCLAASATMFVRFTMVVKRRAKPLRGTVPVVAHLNMLVAGLFGLWLLLDLTLPDARGLRTWTECFAAFLIAGWFASSILGYLARIVPFLWWAYRFQHQWRKKSRVLLTDMVKEARMGVELRAFAAAIGLAAGSIGLAWTPGAIAGLASASVLAVVYLLELARAFRY